MNPIPNNYPGKQECLVLVLFILGTICTVTLGSAATLGIVLPPLAILALTVIGTVVPLVLNRLKSLGQGTIPNVYLNVPEPIVLPSEPELT